MKSIEFLNHSIIAHRGIYNNITIYENTFESIMYAVKNNLSVEIDVRLTKDNKLIVFHDSDGSRFLKLKDNIDSLTKEEMDYLSNYHIPTLEEVLKIVVGKVPIIIDVKEDNKIIRNKLCNILNNYKGDFAIQSFNYESISFYKKRGLISGLLINSNNIKMLNKILNVDFLSIKYDLLDRNQIKLLKEDYYIIGWTINTRKDAEENIKLFNNLIIDNIEEVFK